FRVGQMAATPAARACTIVEVANRMSSTITTRPCRWPGSTSSFFNTTWTLGRTLIATASLSENRVRRSLAARLLDGAQKSLQRNVPAAQHDRSLPVAERLRPLREPCEGYRRRPLDDPVLGLRNLAHGSADFALAHRHGLLDHLQAQRQGNRSRLD